MLDDLLGRTELKERIEELEAEKHHLERRVEAEQERRSEAVSDRQDAEETLNRLEDRIADLEGRLGRETDAPDLGFRREETIRGDRTRDLLSRLRSIETGAEGALSAVVEERIPEAASDLLGDRAALLSRAAPCLFYGDDTGLVSAAVRPPVAPEAEAFAEWADGFRVEESWFLPTGRFAFALVRADLFALGVYEGDERASLRGFETDVKSQHSKGGFSQGRFERIRDGQIRDHLDRCEEALDEADADRLYVVGESTLLEEFAERADATAGADATGNPEAALDHAFHDFWTTRVYGL